MAIEYENYKGKVYYLIEGKTKTGKPKYHFSRKTKGKLAESIPAGFEVYEHHSGQVYLRKIVPRLITEEELQVVEQGLREIARLKHFKLDVKKDVLTVYAPHQNTDDLARSFAPLVGFRTIQEKTLTRFLHFEETLQFVLVDKKERTFAVNRFCYRSSVDDWMRISSPQPLATQVKAYVKHIGKESYFELY